MDHIALWEPAPHSVGSASVADPDVAQGIDELEAVWAAAHTAEDVAEWTPLRVGVEQPSPPSVLFVQEAEVLVYADAVRAAVASVGGRSDHEWLPVVVEAGGSELPYWVLSCHGPEVALPDGRVDPALAGDAAVVHYELGDGFPVFSDAARRAIEAAGCDVVLERADVVHDVR